MWDKAKTEAKQAALKFSATRATAHGLRQRHYLSDKEFLCCESFICRLKLSVLWLPPYMFTAIMHLSPEG
jgi:hypothetical protein